MVDRRGRPILQYSRLGGSRQGLYYCSPCRKMSRPTNCYLLSFPILVSDFLSLRARPQESCWTLSNIVAGTAAQMAAVCDSPGILGGVIDLLLSDVWEVQKEANFVISNIATASNREFFFCSFFFYFPCHCCCCSPTKIILLSCVSLLLK